MTEITIKICMGSSCFSRGNKENLEIIKEYLKGNSIAAEIFLTGNLCQGMCNKGPNLFINDNVYHRVESTGLIKLLEEAIG